jgi:hypothetical protein
MKKLLIALLLIIMPTSYANEINGTRVNGQGAICGVGQSKAVEVNATTKQETSYCYVEIITPVTPLPTPTPTPTQVTTNIDSNKISINDNNISSTSISSGSTSIIIIEKPSVVTPKEPQFIEKTNIYEVNASTKETIIREETIEEWFTRFWLNYTKWWEEITLWFKSLEALNENK